MSVYLGFAARHLTKAASGGATRTTLAHHATVAGGLVLITVASLALAHFTNKALPPGWSCEVRIPSADLISPR